MFVNTLAVRNYPVKEKTFATFLSAVKETAVAAFENQDYPFEELVNQLMVKRDPSRNPLFDVMLTMDNPRAQTPGRQEKEEAKTNTPLRFGSKFDLVLAGRMEDKTLVLNLTYSTSLFKEETALMLGEYFKEIGDIKMSQRLFKKELTLPTEAGDFLF